jgi:hypothetical protein
MRYNSESRVPPCASTSDWRPEWLLKLQTPILDSTPLPETALDPVPDTHQGQTVKPIEGFDGEDWASLASFRENVGPGSHASEEWTRFRKVAVPTPNGNGWTDPTAWPDGRPWWVDQAMTGQRAQANSVSTRHDDSTKYEGPQPDRDENGETANERTARWQAEAKAEAERGADR